MNIALMLDDEICRIKKELKDGEDKWSEFEADSSSEEYDGASNYFGHSDDCFEAGTEYGKYLALRSYLIFLKSLKERG